jgi:hypothetical protein
MYGMRRMEGSQWVAERSSFFLSAGHSFESPIAIPFCRVMVTLVGPGLGLNRVPLARLSLGAGGSSLS